MKRVCFCLSTGNRLQLETDLKIEREWRQTLQNDLERERETVAQLSAEAQQINGLKKVNFLIPLIFPCVHSTTFR